MSETFFKAVRVGGTSFHDPTFRWLPEDGVIPEGGWLVEHPNPGGGAAGYLSAATVATDCTGMDWPCRLLVVKPVGKAWTPEARSLPRKRAAFGWRVVEERPAHEAFGPQGEHVAALIWRAGTLTTPEVDALHAARYAAWDAAWDAARDAAWDAAYALLVRDLISTGHYDALSLPWRRTIGPIHPDDPAVTA